MINLFLEDIKPEEYKGWSNIIESLKSMIDNTLYNANYAIPQKKNQLNVLIHDIKEKFGGLRFYVSFHCETRLIGEEIPEGSRMDMWKTYISEIYGAIHLAEILSMKTCEFCGAPGVLRKEHHWWKVRCDDCEKEYVKKIGEL